VSEGGLPRATYLRWLALRQDEATDEEDSQAVMRTWQPNRMGVQSFLNRLVRDRLTAHTQMG